MKIYKGNAYNLGRPVVGKYTTEDVAFLKRKNYITKFKKDRSKTFGYKASITKEKKPSKRKIPQIYSLAEEDVKQLKNGDILLLNPDGTIHVLWGFNSKGNSILLTEKCNCQCLMCPQPPSNTASDISKINFKLLKLLDPKIKEDICITGGEPTLDKKRFIDTLVQIRDRYPRKNISVLTNGTTFYDFSYAKEVSSLGLNSIMFCVSLHADTNYLHNKITRSKESFEKAIKGIQNLAMFRNKIEVRFVINKMNFKRLIPFSIFIYRNFPFVIHIAFMGLEILGYAKKNFEKIWIDPLEYKSELKSAIIELARRKMNVSIYNIPLCLLDKEVWKFSTKSISDWKNDYLEVCHMCSVRNKCCGIFTTSVFQSSNISPMD